VGPRTCLEDVERRNILSLPGLELDHSAFQPVASRYTDHTDCGTPASNVNVPHSTALRVLPCLKRAQFYCTARAAVLETCPILLHCA
jgi:hypothetical protein